QEQKSGFDCLAYDGGRTGQGQLRGGQTGGAEPLLARGKASRRALSVTRGEFESIIKHLQIHVIVRTQHSWRHIQKTMADAKRLAEKRAYHWCFLFICLAR